MKPRPPVTRHRRPAKAFDRHGVQSAVSVRDPCVSRARAVAVTTADMRTSPSTESHTASSARRLADRAAPRSPARRRRHVRACRGTRSADGRGDPTRDARASSSSSTASSDRALFTWSSTSKSLARSGHGRPVAPAGGAACTSRPRTRRPAGRLAVEVEELVVERERATVLAVDEHPQRRRPRPRAPRSAGELRAALGPARPDPAAERRQLDGVVVHGQAPAISRSLERSTHTPRRSDSSAVVGVVGGDVLEVPGERLEPQPPAGVDVAEVHPAARHGTPARVRAGPRTRPAPPSSFARQARALRIKRATRAVRRHIWGSVPAWHRTRGNGVGSARSPGRTRGAPPLVVHRRVARGRGRSCVVSRAPSTASPTTTSDPRHAVAAGARPARARTSRARRATARTVVFERPHGRRRVRGRSRRSRRASPRSRRSRTSRASTDPSVPLGSAFSLEERRDRARHRAVRHAGAGPRTRTSSRRSQHATAPAADGRASTLAFGGAVVDYADQAAVGQRRPHRSPRRGRDPAVRVRLGGRDGPPDPHRAPRSRRRHLARAHHRRRSPTSARVAPVLATMIGLGRRHRLLAVHRHALPREPRRRHGRSKTRPAARSPPPVKRCCSPARTVVIAICGLADRRASRTSRGSATWPALVVAVMMLAALTLLPAIIGAVGNGIDRWKVPSLIHHPDRAVASATTRPPAGSVWERWATLGRPPRVAVRDPRRLDPARDRVAGAVACASASPTTATSPRPRPNARRTTWSPRASAPAPTARCSSWSQLPTPERRRRCSPTSPPRSQKTPERAGGAPAADQARDTTVAQIGCAPHDARPTARRPPTWSHELRERRCCPQRDRHERCAGLRGRAHRRVHRHRRPDQQTGSPTSSARSCCCRSCC